MSGDRRISLAQSVLNPSGRHQPVRLTRAIAKREDERREKTKAFMRFLAVVYRDRKTRGNSPLDLDVARLFRSAEADAEAHLPPHVPFRITVKRTSHRFDVSWTPVCDDCRCEHRQSACELCFRMGVAGYANSMAARLMTREEVDRCVRTRRLLDDERSLWRTFHRWNHIRMMKTKEAGLIEMILLGIVACTHRYDSELIYFITGGFHSASNPRGIIELDRRALQRAVSFAMDVEDETLLAHNDASTYDWMQYATFVRDNE